MTKTPQKKKEPAKKSRDAELEEMRRFLQQKHAARRAALEKRFLAAKRDFEQIVEMIIHKYRPERIYQWGSLLDFTKFSDISDIDIAVEGITDPETYFALLGDADKMTVFPIDIVQLEKIHPLHAESIRKRGKLIYERPGKNSAAAGRT